MLFCFAGLFVCLFSTACTEFAVPTRAKFRVQIYSAALFIPSHVESVQVESILFEIDPLVRLLFPGDSIFQNVLFFLHFVSMRAM